MAHPNHEIARRYFIALGAGELGDDLLTDDFTGWTTSSPVPAEKARYQGGIRLLRGLFKEPCVYHVDSLTAEDDRVVAEVHSDGELVTGERFSNTYVFVLRIRDGKVASVKEHFDPAPMQAKIMPLIQAALAKQG